MILNRQREYAVDLPALRAYVRRLKRTLRLGEREFNLCLVADREMARLNAAYRSKPRPTDVLSFPWKGETCEDGEGLRPAACPPLDKLPSTSLREAEQHRSLRAVSRVEPRRQAWSAVGATGAIPPRAGLRAASRGVELRGFLGDVAISVETAGRNARLEGHSTFDEIRWLVLHGVLHLLGYDHERDQGEMTRLELALREQLGIAGRPAARRLGKPPHARQRLWAAGRRGRRGWPKRAKGPHE
jgi:ssRNA-specific RNase YbeY (16S rRNA maturation enzyme)